MPFDYSSLLRPELAELRAYVPDLAEYSIRLDANEAPPLLGEAARQRLAEAAAMSWERYPDPTAAALRESIARRCGVTTAEVLVGVGSDEVIATLLTACGRTRRGPPVVLTTTPTFVMYKMSAKVRGMNVVEVPLDEDWDVPVVSLKRALDVVAPGLVFIASPNNPTGTMAASDRLREVVECAPETLFVIDEAYVDYASRDQLDLYHRFPNVAVMRTLSKIGFAALRVGWMIGHPDLIAALDKVRQPYNVNAVSQRLAGVVLDELSAEVDGIVRTVKEERERLAREISAIPGFGVAPREANFLWMSSTRSAEQIHRSLAERGILVRSFHRMGGRLAHQLRITVGTRDQNDALLRALREVS